jgi:hypothetical protein
MPIESQAAGGPASELATAAHFLAYYNEHPLLESQHISLVLGAAVIEQLAEQPEGVEPAGYTLLVHNVIEDHQRGIHGITGEPVPVVIQDDSRALVKFLDFMVLARKAVGVEFADAAYNYYDSARQAARADADRRSKS